MSDKREVKPTDFLDPSTEFASVALRRDRLNACLECEHLRKSVRQCKLCGCFMMLKVRLQEAECPIGKW